MAQSCLIIPKEHVSDNDSQVFLDMQRITDNREEQKRVYATITAAYTSGVAKDIKFKPGTGLREAIDTLKSFCDITSIMSDETLANYANEFDNEGMVGIDNIVDLREALRNASGKYERLTAVLEKNADTMSVKYVPKTGDNIAKNDNDTKLMELNDRLIDRLNNAGFDVGVVNNIGMPGMFSPSDAVENANGLKTAIKVSKGYKGLIAVPEEVAHLVVACMENDPIMNRLRNILSDSDIAMEALGVEYDMYEALYDGDAVAIADEVIGRLIAYNLADMSGISGRSAYLSERFLNRVKSMLSKIDDNGIDNDIRELFENTRDVAMQMVEDDAFWNIVNDININGARKMFKTEAANAMQKMTKDKISLLSKRLRILQKQGKDLPSGTRDNMDKIIRAYENAQYEDAILGFLVQADADITELRNKLDNVRNGVYSNDASEKQKRYCVRTVRDIERTVNAYKDCMVEIASLDYSDAEDNNMNEETVDKIMELSRDILVDVGTLERLSSQYRFAILGDTLGKYWGSDKKVKLGNKEEVLTLEGVLQSWYGDTNGLSRYVNAMADMADPMLQMADMVFKDYSNKRDGKVFELGQRLAVLVNEFERASGTRDTNNLYEYHNGKPTGYLKSEYDFGKFEEAHDRYLELIKAEVYRKRGITENSSKDERSAASDEIRTMMSQWYKANQELVDVGISRNEKPVKQYMPKKSLYGSNQLDTLSSAERKLYDEIMSIKRELDATLPGKEVRNLYLAPQKKKDISDQVLHGSKLSSILKRFKDRFVSSVDDTEFGSRVILDVNGDEVHKVPVFFTTRLKSDEMDLLDTSIADTMLAYGAMAYNYTEMNNVADIMELMVSQMKDRKIIKMDGNNKRFERFKLFSRRFEGDQYINVVNSNTMNKLVSYIERNVYGKSKNEELMNVFGKNLNVGKIADFIKQYSSLVGMGYNLFSGVTNVSMGVIQTFMQTGASNGYWTAKDLRWAWHNYNKMMSDSVVSKYKAVDDNKLNLALKLFDSLEDFSEYAKSSQYNNKTVKRIVAGHSPFLFNSMGEHFLHSLSTLSILHNTKVVDSGKESTLWDVLEVYNKNVNGTDVPMIRVKEGVTKADGTKFTDDELFKIKLMIQEANRKMHGAYGDIDRGEINRMAIGRLMLQFRQWMPAFYTERFKGKRLNVLTGQQEEGFYRAFVNFAWECIKDMRNDKLAFVTNYKNLSGQEKANVNKALIELSVLFAITQLLRFMGGDDDEDDPGIIVAMKYNLYRLKLELGAAAPSNLEFVNNVGTLLKSPVPCMNNFENLLNIFKASSWSRTYDSGMFEGWRPGFKYILYSVPFTKMGIRHYNTIVNADTEIVNNLKNN